LSAPTLVGSKDRFALFWGGGLGDILVVRPLLLALAAHLERPPYFFTTANHLEGLFQALDLPADLHVLPAAPLDALRLFRKLGVRFDWIYLGPHPRLKTRLLAEVVGARRIWNVRHLDAERFIGEQVLADVRDLGLAGTPAATLPYGGEWGPNAVRGGDGGYLVLHPGAKGRWQTKQWPEEKWRGLITWLLGASGLRLILVGTPNEQPMLEGLAVGVPASLRQRVELRTDYSLAALAECLRSSRGVICHNSGVMHLAAMLGKPTLVLTGSAPLHWRPPYANVQNLDSGECSLACDQYRCPVPFYKARCIRELDLDTVTAAVRTLLLSS
jgi:hypothetical protein